MADVNIARSASVPANRVVSSQVLKGLVLVGVSERVKKV